MTRSSIASELEQSFTSHSGDRTGKIDGRTRRHCVNRWASNATGRTRSPRNAPVSFVSIVTCVERACHCHRTTLTPTGPESSTDRATMAANGVRWIERWFVGTYECVMYVVISRPLTEPGLFFVFRSRIGACEAQVEKTSELYKDSSSGPWQVMTSNQLCTIFGGRLLCDLCTHSTCITVNIEPFSLPPFRKSLFMEDNPLTIYFNY